MMTSIRLWLLRGKIARLEDQTARGEILVRETRAQLQRAYGDLRRARMQLAALTPARRLLRDALRRAGTGRAIPLASCQRVDYR